MRIVIGLHHLELGGSQLNALDMATSIRDRGHHVHVVAPFTDVAGPVADMVRDRGMPLTVVRHPHERTRRAALWRGAVSRSLTRVVDETDADIVHCYEYPLILDAVYGPALRRGTPVVGTVYAMAVPSWLPRSVTLAVGTRELVTSARMIGLRATLIVPPVDTDKDDPQFVDGRDFRRRHGIAPSEIVAMIVSRLEPDMKADGVARAMTALRSIDNPQLRVVVVGTGPSYDELAEHARATNHALGREAVTMAGPMGDPRPAYAAADITLGMGGSALRGMAFGKPLIVLGTNGFSRPFDESSLGYFREAGLFGVTGETPDPLAGQMRALLDEPRRRLLGEWSRNVVLREYSLRAATEKIERVYRDALETRSNGHKGAAVRTAVHRTAAELAGSTLRDKFRPMVRAGLRRSAVDLDDE